MTLYRLLARQLIYDLHLGPALFDRLCGDRSTEEIMDVMDRFEIIHASQQRVADAQRER